MPSYHVFLFWDFLYVSHQGEALSPFTTECTHTAAAARFIQLALYANTRGDAGRGITVFLLGDEVVLGFDVGLEGVEVLALVLLDVRGHPLQDVVRRGRAAARAALRAAGLRYHVGVLVHHFVFLRTGGTSTC